MPEPADVPVRISGRSPEIRAGLAVGASSARIGGDAALQVEGPAGNFLGVIPAGESWEATPGGAGVVLRAPRGGRISDRRIAVRPRGRGGFVRVGSRDYRGTLAIAPDRTGITVVNQVELEEYLIGVVGAEMGGRPDGDREAVRAQAIVSRTYALRNRNRWRAQGFDYYASVADQAYTGVSAENELARDAVAATLGLAVTYAGAPIDAFFFSTCGGRTELGTEVFRAATRAYLRSVPDVDASGTAYCAPSPRFRWQESWTGAELRRAVSRGLAEIGSAPAGRVVRVRDIRIAERTASGRVGRLAIALADRNVSVESARVRQVLRSPGGELLRSTLFSMRVTGSGGEVGGLTVEGSGAGHGVGFCQWGAIGRARAGQRYDAIIAAYYPGTRLERFY
ncbi:MAG TPA: SpoIID/LytB domain-containing protein [Gemmatimonadales bacterium]|nr:SpoIID/LytB domain-containing protein [Gemmatimonadales bacterium]